MRRFWNGIILVLCSIPAVFFAAFFVLRYMRISGRDPLFDSDWAIVRYLGVFAALLFGGGLVLTLVNEFFERVVKRLEAGRKEDVSRK